MKWKALLPFLTWLPLINKDSLRADLSAGLTGAVIVLPQGVAFATIAGLPPEYGLYTAMITPIVAALFGSSFHLVSGPTTAISIVVFSTINRYALPGSPEFISLALILTFLAGVYQLIFGLARVGTLVNFVSHTVVVGFTAGAAILIATSQLKHVTGIFVPRGESFLHTWLSLYQGMPNFDVYTFGIALLTLVTAVGSKKIFPKAPNLLIAMVVGSLAALGLAQFTDSIKLVGKLPTGLPPLSQLHLSLKDIKMLGPEAFAVALLGLIEAVSISRAVATKSGQHIDANQEFIGQGLSNIVGSFFSSYAGSGSFTRSGVNYEAGAKTPLSAIFAALALVCIVLLIAPLMAYLPIAAMGGVIFLVAYNLINFKQITHILRFGKTETAILLTTFAATLFLELEFAIYLGVLLSLVLFLAQTTILHIPTLSFDLSPDGKRKRLVDVESVPIEQCPQIRIIRIDMPIYFGSLDHIMTHIEHIVEEEKIYHILIIAAGVNLIDLAGIEALVAENERLKKAGGGLYFAGMNEVFRDVAARSGFIKKLGIDHFFDCKTRAVAAVYARLDKTQCTGCQARIFNECF